MTAPIPTPPALRRPGRLLTAWIAVLGACAVVYGAAVLVHVAPWSAADGLRPASNEVLQPLFAQRWLLFAPEVPRLQQESFFFVRIQGDDGELVEEGPFELSGALVDSARDRAWMPSRLYRFTDSMHIVLARIALEQAVVDGLLDPEDLDVPQLNDLDAESIDPELLELSRTSVLDGAFRLACAAAERRYAADELIALRFVVTQTPVVPYEERGHGRLVPEEAIQSFDSDWRDVGAIRECVGADR